MPAFVDTERLFEVGSPVRRLALPVPDDSMAAKNLLDSGGPGTHDVGIHHHARTAPVAVLAVHLVEGDYKTALLFRQPVPVWYCPVGKVMMKSQIPAVRIGRSASAAFHKIAEVV